MAEVEALATDVQRVRDFAESIGPDSASNGTIESYMADADVYVRGATNTWIIQDDDNRLRMFQLAAYFYAAGLVLLKARGRSVDSELRFDEADRLIKQINTGAGKGQEGDSPTIEAMKSEKKWYTNVDGAEPYMDTY